MDFKGAIFDLDGTLLNSMFIWEQIDREFLGARGVKEVPDDYVQAIAPMGVMATALYTIERFGFDETPESLIKEWGDMALDFYSNKVTLKKGAREYLEYLSANGVKLAVATANDEKLYLPALEHTRIAHYFTAAVSVNDVSRGKGFPDVYELAAEKIGLAPSECMVFEDVLTAAKGAVAGGFRCTGIYDDTSASDKDELTKLCERCITDFTELLP